MWFFAINIGIHTRVYEMMLPEGPTRRPESALGRKVPNKYVRRPSWSGITVGNRFGRRRQAVSRRSSTHPSSSASLDVLAARRSTAKTLKCRHLPRRDAESPFLGAIYDSPRRMEDPVTVVARSHTRGRNRDHVAVSFPPSFPSSYFPTPTSLLVPCGLAMLSSRSRATSRSRSANALRAYLPSGLPPPASPPRRSNRQRCSTLFCLTVGRMRPGLRSPPFPFFSPSA